MTLFALVVMLCYLVAILRCYGVQESVSASYYRLPGSLALLFTLVMWTQVFCLLPVMTDLTPVGKPAGTIAAFFAMGGIGFVGAAPNVIDNEERKVHITGAWVAAVSSQLWVLFVRPWCLSLWLFAIVAAIADRKHLKWWLEIVCMSTIYATIIYEEY